MLSEMNVYDIYVSTTRSILHMIYISWCRKNSQHYMSANTDFNKMSMDNDKQEIFMTLMLALQ